jgi:hypothetical protein
MAFNLDPVVKKEGSRWGLTLAAVNVLFYLVAYVAYRELFVSFWAASVLFVIGIGLVIMAVNSVKKEYEGYIEFKEAFSTAFLVYLIASLILTVVVILLFNVVDPSAAKEIQDMTIEQTIAFAERFGAQAEQLDDMIEKIESSNQYGVSNQVRGFFMGLIVTAIISAIIAAFMKKKRPFDA